MKNIAKALTWSAIALTITNPAYGVTWVQLALGTICALFAMKYTGEIIKEEHDDRY